MAKVDFDSAVGGMAGFEEVYLATEGEGRGSLWGFLLLCVM